MLSFQPTVHVHGLLHPQTLLWDKTHNDYQKTKKTDDFWAVKVHFKLLPLCGNNGLSQFNL